MKRPAINRVGTGTRLPDGITAKSLRAQVNRMLSGPAFVNSDRLSRFLQFIVDQVLQGNADQLKEYSLGIAVFDRKESFDPRVDPIVRVEASRLRNRIKQYYENEGRQDEIVVELTKGSYVPVFLKKSAPEPAPPAIRSARNWNTIAVLPFADHSPERDQEYFCDGMTEEIINALTKLPMLRVVAWTSSRRLKGHTADIAEIGQQLNVGTVVTGSLRKSGERLRITTQLIDAGEGCYLWSESYDRELKDVFAIQEEIARAIVATLRIQIADEGKKRLVKRYTDNLEAYNLYLQGRYFWNQRSETGLKKGIGYFEQAIAKDPSYALAYAGLSDSYSLLGNYGVLPSKKVKASASAAALKAVEIDDTLAEAHTALGHVKATYYWDWWGAEAEYKRALELNPGYATLHHWYAVTYLAPMGRLDEAMLEIGRAQELDPISVSIRRDLALILYDMRRYDQAIEQCRRTIELDPGFHGGYWVLGLALEQKSMFEEASAAFENGLALSGGSPRMIGALGHSYAVSGKREQAEEVIGRLRTLSQQRWVSPFETALIYMGLRESDIAFEWLDRAYEAHSYELVPLKVDPRFDVLRSDSRFEKLLRNMKLVG